jgi:hypothetical protein
MEHTIQKNYEGYELEAVVEIDYCPGDFDTPEYCDVEIQELYIWNEGKRVDIYFLIDLMRLKQDFKKLFEKEIQALYE